MLIVVDTLRRDHLPMFGGDLETPHIAALARQGVAVEALASFHQTSMSMGALFTGRTPSLETGDPAAPLDWQSEVSCGMARFADALQEGACLPSTLETLPERIRARGYHTIGVAANALLFDPAGFSRGFDVWKEVGRWEGRKPRNAAQLRTWRAVNAAVRDALEALPEAPLFLYVHYLDVHDWLYRGMTYPESVEEMDEGIGDLMALLDEHGLLDDAAIVLASDHGELIDEEHVVPSKPLHSGNPSYRQVLDVPLILVGTDGVRLPELVRTQDLHGVLLDIAGVPDEPESEVLAPDEVFLSELIYQTYRRGRFKSFLRRDGRFTLIDLEQDPQEKRDAAALHPEVVATHRQRIESLTDELAARSPDAGATRASEEWLDRLRALGYLQ